MTIVGEKVRLTHLIIPSIALPKVPPATNSLLTPETSDLSGQSSSDRDVYTDTSGESDTESDAGTAMGEEIGYSLDPEPEAVSTTSRDLQGIPPFVDTALLQRIPSNTSSTYASSEGDSDFDGLGDSLTLRPTVDTGGWTVVEDTGSESGSLAEVKKPRQLAGTQVTRKGRMDRPSFFEYLYGA